MPHVSSRSTIKKILVAFVTVFILMSSMGLMTETALAADQSTKKKEEEATFWTKQTWNVANWVGGTVVRFGGNLLDITIVNLVIGMGELMTGSIGTTVNSVWVVIRDVFNLLFIFALVYIGLRIIWDAGDGGAKRDLARLIVAALLINFSLFFAKVIVDMGNVAAIQIYALYFNIEVETTVSIESVRTSGIAANVLQHIGLSKIGSGEVITAPKSVTMGFAIMVMLFLIVTGFVFAAGAFMLVGRFILLCMYMMFAPFMFIGYIIPNFGNYQTQWWNGFLKQVFVAPAFMFTTYIAIRIIAEAKNQTMFAGNFAAELANGSSSTGGTLLIVVALGFMMLALSIANKMGAVGAATSIKLGKSAMQRGRKYAEQPVRWGARKSSDAAGSSMRRGLSNLQTMQTNNMVTRGIQKIARTSSAEQIVGGAATGLQNAKYGTSQTQQQKRDKAAMAENQVASRVTLANGLRDGATDAEKQAMKREAATLSVKDLENMDSATRDQLAPFLTGATAQGYIKSEKASPADVKKFQKARVEALKETVTKMGEVMSKDFSRLSLAQLEELGEEFVSQNAHMLSQDQIKGLRTSKVYTEAQVGGFEATRKATLTATGTGPVPADAFRNTEYDATTGAIKKEFKSASEIAKLPKDVLLKGANAAYITSAALREMENNPDLTFEDKQKIKSNVNSFGKQEAKDYINSPRGQREWST